MFFIRLFTTGACGRREADSIGAVSRIYSSFLYIGSRLAGSRVIWPSPAKRHTAATLTSRIVDEYGCSCFDGFVSMLGVWLKAASLDGLSLTGLSVG
jgi:hypothetical protein